jgi:membrane protein implicated in regulation of membrane protease activity
MIDGASRTEESVAELPTAESLLASRVGAALVILGLGLAAVAAFTGPNWTLLWLAFVTLVLAVVAPSVVRRMDYGQD